MNKIKWELIVAVLGLIFAGLSFFRDLTGYEVKRERKEIFYPDEYGDDRDIVKEPERKTDNNPNPKDFNSMTENTDIAFPFDTITISKDIFFSVTNNGVLNILKAERPLPSISNKYISSVVPIRDIVKFEIFSHKVPKKNTIFGFSLKDNTESQVFQTDNFFDETLFLQFIKFKIVKHNQSILIDRKVIQENPIWTFLTISCLFLPVFMQFIIGNIFGGKYKSKHGFIAIIIGLILVFIGYTIDVMHQIN